MPNEEPFTATEIQRAQATMGLIGSLSKSIDWNRYVSCINYAETVAPFIDPTTWIRSPHELRRLTTDMARLLAKYQTLYSQCEAEMRRVVEREGEKALNG